MNILEKLFGPPVPAVSPAEAQAKMKARPAPYLLDVRQPEEYRDAHIAGAALIPLSELGQRLAELPREREILCVCRSGSRSHAAAQQLLRAGYQAVDLRGGMLAWQAARLPVKPGMAR